MQLGALTGDHEYGASNKRCTPPPHTHTHTHTRSHHVAGRVSSGASSNYERRRPLGHRGEGLLVHKLKNRSNVRYGAYLGGFEAGRVIWRQQAFRGH